MRKAAGILLIILGVFGLVALTSVGDLVFRLSFVPFVLWRTVYLAFLITGGVFYLRRKYWRVCLASASLGVLVGVIYVAEPIVAFGRFTKYWDIWIVFIAAVIATIFIAVRRKEWQAISNSVDCEVSKGG